MKKTRPEKPLGPFWIRLGVKKADETIVVLGFKLGAAADARQVMQQRAKDEAVDDFEMFNIFDPAPSVRDDVYGWLLATGASVEDAKESSIAVFKSVAEELKSIRRRRGGRGGTAG